MTITQLKKICDQKNIPIPPKATKAQLIELINTLGKYIII